MERIKAYLQDSSRLTGRIPRTMRIYGKDKLIELLKSETELWTILGKVGLTKENINEKLRRPIKLPLTGVLGQAN